MPVEWKPGDRVDMTPPGGRMTIGTVVDVDDAGVTVLALGAACYVPTGPLRDAIQPLKEQALSYARRGARSDVYVYLHAGGHLACSGCDLGQVEHYTTADMVAHLEAHRAAGHTVPDDTIAGLLADAAENDLFIEGVDIIDDAEGWHG